MARSRVAHTTLAHVLALNATRSLVARMLRAHDARARHGALAHRAHARAHAHARCDALARGARARETIALDVVRSLVAHTLAHTLTLRAVRSFVAHAAVWSLGGL